MIRTLALILCMIAPLAQAAPERYQLDAARSQVNFSFSFNGSTRTGQMPVKSAKLLIDLDNVPASQVSVTVNASAARAGFVFATQTMKSADVLFTKKFPEIHFRSTRFRGSLLGATVTGDLTVRGVTLPVTLKAELFRQRGTAVGDRNNLVVLLTGVISRAAFGADGYSTFVDDAIGLRILARITK